MFGFGSKPQFDRDRFKMCCQNAIQRTTVKIANLRGKAVGIEKDIVAKFQRGDVELAKICVENLINIKKDMFILQSLQVYITNLDTSVGVIMMEKDPPHSLETCIGTILSCRNKVDIDELGAICQMLDSKYKGKISMLQNSGDSHIIERLAPSVPSNIDVENTLKQVLNARGINYDPFTPSPNLGLQNPIAPPAVIDTIPPYPGNNPRGNPAFPAPPPPAAFPSFPAGNPSHLFPSIPAGPQFPQSSAVPGPSPFPSIPAGPGLPQNAGMGARFPPPAPGFGGETAGKRPPLDTSPRSAPGGGLFPSLWFVCWKQKEMNDCVCERESDCILEGNKRLLTSITSG